MANEADFYGSGTTRSIKICFYSVFSTVEHPFLVYVRKFGDNREISSGTSERVKPSAQPSTELLHPELNPGVN